MMGLEPGWSRLPSFIASNGKRVHFVHAPVAYGPEGGTIYAQDAEVSLNDVDYPPELRHRIGSLTWNRRAIQYMGVGRDLGDGWLRQGVGREMLRLAREIEPDLRHAPCTERSEQGERFVRGTDPDKACRGHCEPDCRDWASQIGMPGEEDAPASVRPPSMWEKITGFFRR